MLDRILLLALLAAASGASAAPVDIQVRGTDGRPLAGAVVMLDSQRKPAMPRPSGMPTMAQQNIAFQPHVLIVPTGAVVAFPNRDKVRHHVYSFSRPRKFELKLYGREEARTVTFDKPGVVAVGCNIHDAMSGFIVVVDTPFAVQTDAAGHARFADVPAGGATLRVWHPSVRAPGNELRQPAPVPPGGLSRIVSLTG